MIKRIEITNFKSLKEISMNTRPLNLLAGLNGMGKSSFIQTLLLLKQSEQVLRDNALLLNGFMVDIGKGQDALYQFASEEIIEFSFLIDDNTLWKWSFAYAASSDRLEAEETAMRMSRPDFLKRFQYLSAERIGPMGMYDTSQSYLTSGNLGVKGEYAVHYLHVHGNSHKINNKMKHPGTKELTLMNQVNAWLDEISPGVRLRISELPGVDKMLLNYQFELGAGRTAFFRPCNVGYGISYVLSIVVSLLASERGSVIIAENPEAHIHPRGQAELGKLMALAASCGVQLFIETHSDHIINGIRAAVKEGLIDQRDVGFHYFTKITTNDEQYTNIVRIDVDKHGELSEYPEDFLDEWNNQLLNLVQ
jgi:predicted ATPase